MILGRWLLQARVQLRRQVRRRRLRSAARMGHSLRVAIGEEGKSPPGWLISDLPELDALKPGDWAFIFQPHSISHLLLEHVVEHWTTQQMGVFLDIARDYLTRDGRIRIAVPDGNHPDPAYIEAVRPGGSGPGAEDHKMLYVSDTFEEVARAHHYTVELLERFDASHQFHAMPWSTEDGFIERSAQFDPRNTERLVYTSLLADLRPS